MRGSREAAGLLWATFKLCTLFERGVFMAQSFSKGDKVSWNTSGGETTGTVVEKLTKATDIDAQHVAASEDDPCYLVESDKSGKKAAHKPGSLTKKG